MKKLMKKRTGFTLVELLIVIIIIGILAGAMLLVAGSGQDKAEATKIVSNLRSLKAAALMFWADNPNAPVASIDATDGIDLLKPYMDRDITAPNNAKYQFVATDVTPVVWAVGLIGTDNYPTTGVRTKLGEMKDAGLYKSETVASGDEYDGTTDEAWMRAR